MSTAKKARVRVLLLLVVVILCVEVSMGGGVEYKVGGSHGWSNVANVDYRVWTSNITFHVGDTIVFEYNKDFHNVLRVNHTSFRHCISAAPITTFDSGNDTFKIRRHGHYYFICGFPGHCQAGQKVDIRVPKSITPAPELAPEPTPTNSAVVPSSSPAPAPAPTKSGSSLVVFNNKILVGLVMVMVAFSV